ncbi:hypothetical protein I6A84_02030 [Frankia sp. CNm7]|uniref:Uncharacterized protein n=1 Tax=Frankia nepalensis TaxID=1836974 RepID=A0A937RG51_9ACTN|nr:hypothetical protein [Frankia nepalensis]MBL7497328.1 hypothetical protein [Frankia nepalensis]MBL7509715.1 hypothetical protein [Frankia nepalensis]MBL7516937.1 hypothetical protein [Frankia nepalensis]MBL7629442.1 hypothetical protein [Frankia nepalensis]
MTAVRIDLEDGGGLGPLPVDLGPVRLPRRAGVLLDAYPWPDFVPAGRYPADGAARALAGSGTARVLVACPALVSPGRSMLALAVGRLLLVAREMAGAGPLPVLMCAVRPRCPWESGGVVVPHPVTVSTREGVQHRVVWEITDDEQVPDLLASLRRMAPSVAA